MEFIFKGGKPRFVTCCTNGTCTSDASDSFFVAGAVLCPRQRTGRDLGQTSLLAFSVSIFPGARNIFTKI